MGRKVSIQNKLQFILMGWFWLDRPDSSNIISYQKLMEDGVIHQTLRCVAGSVVRQLDTATTPRLLMEELLVMENLCTGLNGGNALYGKKVDPNLQ